MASQRPVSCLPLVPQTLCPCPTRCPQRLAPVTLAIASRMQEGASELGAQPPVPEVAPSALDPALAPMPGGRGCRPRTL